jgi:DNA-binding CsgD family transcriptional regulator
MGEEKYSAKYLQKIFEKEKISTIDPLKKALGTKVRMTVIRKLNELEYQTSYSHNGKYYTLKKLCHFDKDGLWSYENVWFSLYGTLLETGRTFIDRSVAGYSVKELDEVLHVSTKQSLIHLNKLKLIDREKLGGLFIYFSANERLHNEQVFAREKLIVSPTDDLSDAVLAHELKAAIVLFYSLLNQRERRLFAGLESMQLGGDAKVARILGIDPHTVSKGRNQLLAQDTSASERKPSGRYSIEKKHQK